MIHIRHGRIKNLGLPLKHILNHPPPPIPIQGPDKNPIPDKNPASNLLEESSDDAEELGSDSWVGGEGARVRVSTAGGFDDDAHEVGLGGGDEADGLGGEEVAGFEGGEGGEGEGGEAAEGVAGSEEVLGWRGICSRVRVRVLGGEGDEGGEAAAGEEGEGRGREGRAAGEAEEGERGEGRHSGERVSEGSEM